MKYLITGDSGFVGRNLCNHLLALGHEVIGVSRKERGKNNSKYIFNSV